MGKKPSWNQCGAKVQFDKINVYIEKKIASFKNLQQHISKNKEIINPSHILASYTYSKY